MANNCASCFYHGQSRVSDNKYFCLLNSKWEKNPCKHYTEFSYILHGGDDEKLRIQYALSKRLEINENRRLSKLLFSNWILIIVTFIIGTVSSPIIVKLIKALKR